jgi:hypothetical protein
MWINKLKSLIGNKLWLVEVQIKIRKQDFAEDV